MNRAERILILALCVMVGAFYAWTVWSTGDDLSSGPGKRDYYNLLIEGWIDGHLHMKTPVPPELLALENPYDPEERPAGIGLHDASLYRGKYYVYFGVAPALLTMLPYRLVTGTEMPLAAAVLAFVYGGFLTSVALFCAVRRRYFPDSGRLVLAAGVLTLGFAGAGLGLLRRPEMWELPISGGAFFAMATLLAIWRSLHTTRRRAWWFTGAGLALGLAIASRPTYLFALPLLAAPLAWWWWSERRVPGREVLAALAPLAIIGAALAWHNYARFGNPLEFGQAYQLSLDYESKLPHFAARYVPFTVKAHFFAAAEWRRYFPFIGSADLGPAPAGFTVHRGDIYGVLVSYPIAWLAWLAPLALWRREAAERGPLGAWLAAAALLFAGVAALMLSFFSALSRYQADFLPAFMLLAVVGLLAAERRLPARARVAAGVAAGLATAYGVIFGVLFSLQFDGLLKYHEPAIHAQVARVLNRVPAALERGFGETPGPIELTVRWAAPPPQGEEILARIGRPPFDDRLVARHSGDGRVRLGFVLPDAAERFSPPFALTPGRAHHVVVSLASLLPPATHPYFSGRSPDEIRARLRRAEIVFDGTPVLREHLRLERSGFGEVHAGSVESWRRIAGAGSAASEARPRAGTGDALLLRVRLPARRPPGREPLVVTGRTGAGDLLMIEYLGGDEVRFALDHWSSPLRESPPVRLAPEQTHEFEISLDSLRAVEDATLARPERKGGLRVVVDGTKVWEDELFFFAAEAAEVWIGRNAIGGTGCGPSFTGDVLLAERVARE